MNDSGIVSASPIGLIYTPVTGIGGDEVGSLYLPLPVSSASCFSL